jgi:hypothetical protein
MSLFDQIASAMGGPEKVERFARGEVNFSDDRSPDFQRWNDLVGSAPPERLREAIGEAARRVDRREYDEHVTPGVGGTDPLGGLQKGALAGFAASLLRNLGGGGGLADLIPGLRTTDPDRMSSRDVADLAKYARERDPDAFSRAATEVGRQQPNLLQSLLGNKALMLGAAALAAKVMADRHRRSA